MAFDRVYLDIGTSVISVMDVEVPRYLAVLNRKYEWEVEVGDYTFVLMDHSGSDAGTGVNVTMRCVG